MAINKKGVTTRDTSRACVFKYGLRAPTHGREAVMEQMRLAARYRNVLVDIYNESRDARRALPPANERIAALTAECAEAEDQCKRAVAVIKEARVRTRRRVVDSVLTGALADALERKKVVTAAKREERARVAAEREARKASGEKSPRDLAEDAIYEHRATRVAEARGVIIASGLHWGTVQTVVDAVTAADRTTKLLDRGEPRDLRHIGFRGEGSVTVQIQTKANGTLYATSSLPNDTHRQVRLDPRVSGKNSRGAEYTVLHMIVNGKSTREHPRAHLMAAWPVKIHRPLPLGNVTRVTVHARRVGPRIDWSVDFSVVRAPAAPRCGAGTVAIHFGWLSTERGIRVATWMDEHGHAIDFVHNGVVHRGELLLPEHIAVSLAKADSIGKFSRSKRKSRDENESEAEIGADNEDKGTRSIRARHFNQCRTSLREWIGTGPALPEWFASRVAHMSKWQSPARLGALVARWRRTTTAEFSDCGRFPGDEEIFAIAEEWRKRDRHLWAYEVGLRDGALGFRKDLYRCLGATLAKRYGTIVTDGTLFGALVKRDTHQHVEGGPAPAHLDRMDENRKLAALYGARQAVRNAVTMREGVSEIVPAAGISTQCPQCRITESNGRDSEDNFFVCGCGFERDIESVALMNMLARAGFEREVAGIVLRGERAIRALRDAAAAAE